MNFSTQVGDGQQLPWMEWTIHLRQADLARV
jgi:hypothetical protein